MEQINREPVNIAVIKYWGKRDEELILPLNSSLSVTLGIEELHSTTTVAASQEFCEDCLWLNGRKHDIAEMPRIQKCLTKSMLETNNNHNNKYDTLHLSKHILQYFCLEIEPFTYISYILCREQNWSKFFLVSEKI